MLRVPVLTQKKTPNDSVSPEKLLTSLNFSWLPSSAGSQSNKGFTGLSLLYIHPTHREFDPETIYVSCRLWSIKEYYNTARKEEDMSKFGITQKMTIRHKIPISSWKSLSRFIDEEMLQHRALLGNGCIFN